MERRLELRMVRDDRNLVLEVHSHSENASLLLWRVDGHHPVVQALAEWLETRRIQHLPLQQTCCYSLLRRIQLHLLGGWKGGGGGERWLEWE